MKDLDEILNKTSNKHAPYVGASAFAHKGGLHVSAVKKDPKTYEHIDPELVGNERSIVVSDQAGRSNVIAMFRAIGIEIDEKNPKIENLIETIKEREHRGYAYDGADASFEILARRALSEIPLYYKLNSFRVIDERRWNARNELITISEATIKASVGESEIMNVSGRPHDGVLPWWNEVKTAKSREEFADSGKFATLDLKIYKGLLDTLAGDFKITVQQLENERLTTVKDGDISPLKGRELAFMMIEKVHKGIAERDTNRYLEERIEQLRIQGNNIRRFHNQWDKLFKHRVCQNVDIAKISMFQILILKFKLKTLHNLPDIFLHVFQMLTHLFIHISKPSHPQPSQNLDLALTCPCPVPIP